MKLKIKSLNFSAGRPVAMLSQNTAKKLNVHVDDRVIIRRNSSKVIAVVDIARKFICNEELAVSQEVLSELKARENELVSIELSMNPESISLIHKKLDCKPLSKQELEKIIHDIVENSLTESEIAYFVSAVYQCGMSIKEIEYLIQAIVKNGKTLKLKGIVADKHSIGGIAGNRTTPIVASICSSQGVIMPKTSSRAITSAAGTADVIESVARVEFTIQELYKIIKKAGACLVWGGSLGLAPADDKIIQIERLMHLDPEPQLLASILAKKISVGSKYILIDIPFGKSAKVSKAEAIKLKKKFEIIAKDFKLNLKCVLTKGDEPIGNAVGPVLEMLGVLEILKQEGSRALDLEKKSLKLAGIILEMTGKAKKGQGENLAGKILVSGLALKQFKKIISAQHGNFNRIQKAKFSKIIESDKKGKIFHIVNKEVNLLARVLGSPTDKGAGIYLHAHKNDRIKRNQKLMTFYSESREKINEAVRLYHKIIPVEIK